MPDLRHNGWIKIYRSFLEWEWYCDTNCVRLALHFILKANYQPKKWKGITIDRGQLITSRGCLSDETGLSEMQVRTAMDKLTDCGFITKIATKSYTVITICNYDVYQPLSSDDNQDNSQVITNEQPSDNQAITTTKESNNTRIQEDNTHSNNLLLGDKKGAHTPEGAPASANVRNMLAWIETNYPDIHNMPEPFNETHIGWMLDKYSEDDIKRLIAVMHNKDAAKNKDAFSTFSTFAGMDYELKARREQKEQLWTYAEVTHEVTSQRRPQSDFEITDQLGVDGKPLWKLAKQ